MGFPLLYPSYGAAPPGRKSGLRPRRLLSGDAERRACVVRCGLALHRLHPRLRRAALQPIGECVDGVGFTRGQHFDAAVGQVAGVAAQSQPLRLLAGAGAEEHALHLARSEEHTSELQSLMRISYAVVCLKKKKNKYTTIYKAYM